jgi:FkbM family methyltransferase
MSQSTYQRTRHAVGQWLAATASRRYNLRPDASWGCLPLPLIAKAGMQCRGIIHVGANSGQEFEDYQAAGLDCVLYIEPIPAVFKELQQHVAGDPRHRAIQALCADRSGEEYEFNVASNAGESSSILAFSGHAEEHPNVRFESKIKLTSSTLDDIVFGTPGIDIASLDCLVIDVQGAEMKVIKGADRTLSHCRFLFCEVSVGGLYEGDTPYKEVVSVLEGYGYQLRSLDINQHGWGNAFLVKAAAHT